eukprot:2080454-Amphidinium_carterae.1
MHNFTPEVTPQHVANCSRAVFALATHRHDAHVSMLELTGHPLETAMKQIKDSVVVDHGIERAHMPPRVLSQLPVALWVGQAHADDDHAVRLSNRSRNTADAAS